MSAAPEDLDPADWDEFRALAHRAVDDAINHVATVRERAVWRPLPESVVAALAAPLPRAAQGLAAVYEDFARLVLPYPMGNTHPRFFAWYMGNGTAQGALAEYLAATLNSNMGGGNHAPNLVEGQVVDWCRQIMGLPEGSSGLLVSGASMANLVALAVARNASAGFDLRREGVQGLAQRTSYYASSEVHSCIQKALELLGLGTVALRKVPVDADYRLQVPALAEMIAADRANGLKPCAVIATAGTINTGAVDDLAAIGALCARERLWFHVDGAIGAVLTLSPRHRALVAGIERADSVALDLHKWLHVPFEAGCVLVREGALHKAAFAVHPDYLERQARGLASGATWYSEFGVELSRGFRALKVWMTFKEHGLDKFGRLLDQNIAQAARLRELIAATPALEFIAAGPLNIVCFRYNPGGKSDAELNTLNAELLIRLHESGLAVPSYTTLGDRYCLRVAIANHRTRDADLKILVRAVVELGARLP
jgi:glutamate/tyrosine decarboxylase-like PLP-dependent enzyme